MQWHCLSNWRSHGVAFCKRTSLDVPWTTLTEDLSLCGEEGVWVGGGTLGLFSSWGIFFKEDC